MPDKLVKISLPMLILLTYYFLQNVSSHDAGIYRCLILSPKLSTATIQLLPIPSKTPSTRNSLPRALVSGFLFFITLSLSCLIYNLRWKPSKHPSPIIPSPLLPPSSSPRPRIYLLPPSTLPSPPTPSTTTTTTVVQLTTISGKKLRSRFTDVSSSTNLPVPSNSLPHPLQIPHPHLASPESSLSSLLSLSPSKAPHNP